MAGLTSPAALKNLFTTLYTTFMGVTSGAPASDLSELVTPVSSTDLFNTYAWLGAFPKWREWIGPRAVNGLKQRAYTIYNKSYESTIGIDRDSWEDAKMADTQMIVSGLAQEAAMLPRDLIIEALVNGHLRNAYDGQYFLDTDHPTDLDNGTGTQSNYESTGFALTRANLIIARSRMRGFKGENNRSMRGGMGGLALVVPLALEQTAIDIVGVDYVVSGTGMTNNTLKNAAKVIVVPELDAYSTTAWYLVDIGSPGPKPFILQTRRAPTFVSLVNMNDPNVFWHKEFIFGGEARMGVGYGAWHKIFKGVG